MWLAPLVIHEGFCYFQKVGAGYHTKDGFPIPKYTGQRAAVALKSLVIRKRYGEDG